MPVTDPKIRSPEGTGAAATPAADASGTCTPAEARAELAAASCSESSVLRSLSRWTLRVSCVRSLESSLVRSTSSALRRLCSTSDCCTSSSLVA